MPPKKKVEPYWKRASDDLAWNSDRCVVRHAELVGRLGGLPDCTSVLCRISPLLSSTSLRSNDENADLYDYKPAAPVYEVSYTVRASAAKWLVWPRRVAMLPSIQTACLLYIYSPHYLTKLQ